MKDLFKGFFVMKLSAELALFVAGSQNSKSPSPYQTTTLLNNPPVNNRMSAGSLGGIIDRRYLSIKQKSQKIFTIFSATLYARFRGGFSIMTCNLDSFTN